MEVRHQIELWMTVALALYLTAFFIARRSWASHVVLAISGFVADMYATYLMVVISQDGVSLSRVSVWVQLHTVLSLSAIGLFFFQAYLGYHAKWGWPYERWLYRDQHIKFAKWVFLPTWAVAYASGFLLFL
ncbi:MAG: hypothetical protein AB200_01860 [Parcubacteria bacterium C7867-005]|nr:MAG: hypothetical protein AB200_01860 [Parcubacteria bacterium C7867-005]